ncbi:hypothetical protein J31TS4_00260 [Paenibacillus sp. J31TS4]|uniref:DegV family protein n=1 Tax=Paenibacillus sp. J31TS4 TaxID=2807195 RepID=UPI001B27C686|nr:DegV family protein [Paenibacillus sp. J31TS4]GIP36746.1 hypothetical protein J31TS4_00260 [Paenibacillus sp. J31TS4]
MSRVRIVTDSTSDIPAELRQELGIEVVPLKVHLGTETFLDSVNIEPEQFYERLAQSSAPPTTSQPSPVDFVELYKRILSEDPEASILSIHLSSAMSGTYQSAVLARSLLEQDADITTIDSRSACYGFGQLVVLAAEAARDGKSKDEIVAMVEKARDNMVLYFLVDTLEYLQKGGRIGKASALLGSLLNIKPILSIDQEGSIYSIDKARGTKKAMARIMELMKKQVGDDRTLRVVVAHANAMPAAEELSASIRQHFQVSSLGYTSIGPVIGTHAGPGTVAVFALVE